MKLETASIRGIIPPILTPMNPDESVNHEELRRQVRRLLAGGVHGIFAFGTNGEGYALRDDEKVKILETVVDETAGRVPVYAGSGCVTTRDTICMSKYAQSCGADVLSINRMGSALILLCMGARLHVQGLGARLHDTLPTVAVRLIVMPAVVTSLAVLLGFRGQARATVFLYISTSFASVGYIMAASMGADGDIAAESICLSSIFSVATVSAGLLLLAHMGWIP